MPTWFGSGRFSSAIKVANYTALNGEIVLVDVSAGNWTLTAPPTPEVNSSFGLTFAGVSTLNTVTITAGGTPVQISIASSATSVDVPSEIGFTMFFAYDGTQWRIMYEGSKRDLRLPLAQLLESDVTSTFIVPAVYTDLGLEVTVVNPGLYDFRVSLNETHDFLGNQDMEYRLRITKDAAPFGNEQPYHIVGTAGVIMNGRQSFSYYVILPAGVYRIQGVRDSPGIYTIENRSLLQLVGPLGL